MTLQASGPISMSQIRAEFGGSAPDALSEYYRGGGLVPNIGANAAIPTSGAIAMSNFYNGTAAVPGLSTTITYGSGVTVSYYPTPGFFPSYIPGTAATQATGYDGGADPYSYGPGYGSIGTSNFYDGGLNARNCSMCAYVIGTYVGNNSIIFALDQTSVPDNNTTFVSIDINGLTLNRSARTGYQPSVGGTSYWFWNGVGQPFTGGTVSFTITC